MEVAFKDLLKVSEGTSGRIWRDGWWWHLQGLPWGCRGGKEERRGV